MVVGNLNRTVHYYDVVEGSTVHTVLRLRGGGCAGMSFTDVSDPAGPEKLEWSDDAPDWSVARPGLCLEGKCTNRGCVAYGEEVTMNQGYSDFDLINDASKCQCPMCHRGVVPVTCAFNNCWWKVVGRKIDRFGKRPEAFCSNWKEAGDTYERFSPEKSGEAHFLELKILCQRFKVQEMCVVCGMVVREWMKDMKMAACGHQFHAQSCFDLATNVGKMCIKCLANRSMTSYQKQF